MDRFEVWRKRVSEQRALVALGVSVAAGGPGLLAAPASAQLSPGCSQSGSTVTCKYTSGSNEVQIPAGVTSVNVEAVGGTGGSSGPSASGGYGAVVEADLPVSAPVDWWAVVGGNGGNGPGANGGGAAGGIGGLPGDVGTGDGGGASDVRTSANDLSTRLLVAGGGGGGGAGSGVGGAGGGYAGTGFGRSIDGGGGRGGTSSAGGSGGTAGTLSSCPASCVGLGDGSAGQNGSGGAGGPGSVALQGTGPPPCPPGSILFRGSFCVKVVASGGSGGGGGGGLFGGGGGGGGAFDANSPGSGGGGGGGSNLVPPGGSQTVDTKNAPMVQLSYTLPAATHPYQP